MSQLLAANSYIIVEQYDKLRKKETSLPFVTPLTSNNLGTVKYSADAEYPAGTKVYYGGSYERMMVEGIELVVLKRENIVAILLD